MENKNGKIGSKRERNKPTVRAEDVTAEKHSQRTGLLTKSSRPKCTQHYRAIRKYGLDKGRITRGTCTVNIFHITEYLQHYILLIYLVACILHIVRHGDVG